MMGEYVIENVEEILIGGAEEVEAWRIDYRLPDGTLHNHFCPKEALEWRMAEYELPTVEEGIKFLIHEPFMDRVLRDPQLSSQMTVQNGMKTTRRIGTTNYETPLTLFNAETRGQARKAQQDRIELARTQMKVSSKKDKKGKDPLDVMRNTHRVTEAGKQGKSRQITAQRQRTGLDKDLPTVASSRRRQPVQPQQSVVEKFFDQSAKKRVQEQKADPDDHMWN